MNEQQFILFYEAFHFRLKLIKAQSFEFNDYCCSELEKYTNDASSILVSFHFSS